VTAESAVPIERTRDAAAATALVQLQPAVPAPRIITLVDNHRGLIATRTKAGRNQR